MCVHNIVYVTYNFLEYGYNFIIITYFTAPCIYTQYSIYGLYYARILHNIICNKGLTNPFKIFTQSHNILLRDKNKCTPHSHVLIQY